MKIKRSLAVLAAVAFITVATLACQFGAAPISAQPPQADAPVINTEPPIAVQAPVNPAAAQDAFTALYQRVIPGVVVIKITSQQGEALGSGFVYDSKGHVVTNYHVVQG